MRISFLLAGMLLLAPLSAPASAELSPGDVKALSSLWSGAKDEYFLLHDVDGELGGGTFEIADGGARKQTGNLLFDQNASSATHLIGMQKTVDSQTARFDLVVQGDVSHANGASLFGYVEVDGMSAPIMLQNSEPDSLSLPRAQEIYEAMAATVWDTPLGQLSVGRRGDSYYGEFRDPKTDQVRYRIWSRTPLESSDFGQVKWSWLGATEKEYPPYLVTVLSMDRKTILAGYEPAGSGRDTMDSKPKWTGTRYGSKPSGAGDSTATPAPAPAPGGSTTGGSSQPGPAPVPQGDGSFRPLGKYSVRLDRVVAGKGGDLRTHVFLTLKNAAKQKLYVTSGQLLVRVTDGNGVNKENGQVLQPLEDSVKLFESTPVLDPGEELKVQYAIVTEGGSGASKVTVMEGDKRVSF